MVLIRIKNNRCPLSNEEKQKLENEKAKDSNNKNKKQLKCSFWSWIPPWYFDNVCDDKYGEGMRYLIYLYIVSIFMTLSSVILTVFVYVIKYVMFYMPIDPISKILIGTTLDFILLLCRVLFVIFGILTVVLFVVFAIISLIYFALHMVFGSIVLLIPPFCVCCSMGIFEVYSIFFGLVPFIQVPGAFVISTAALMKIYMVQVLGKEINDKNPEENEQLTDDIATILKNNNEDLNFKLCPETLKEIKAYVSKFNPPVALQLEKTNSEPNKPTITEPFTNSYKPPMNAMEKVKHDNCILRHGGYIDNCSVDKYTACFLNSLMDMSCSVQENIPINITTTTTQCRVEDTANIKNLTKGFGDMWSDNMSNLAQYDKNFAEEQEDAAMRMQLENGGGDSENNTDSANNNQNNTRGNTQDVQIRS